MTGLFEEKQKRQIKKEFRRLGSILLMFSLALFSSAIVMDLYSSVVSDKVIRGLIEFGTLLLTIQSGMVAGVILRAYSLLLDKLGEDKTLLHTILIGVILGVATSILVFQMVDLVEFAFGKMIALIFGIALPLIFNLVILSYLEELYSLLEKVRDRQFN